VTFETGLDGSRPVNQYAKRLDRRSRHNLLSRHTHTQTHKTGCSTWPTEVVNNDEKRRPAQQWSSCYVWATTLNFGPNVQIHNRTYWPKYGPPRPISTGTASPEKNLEIRFFSPKWRRKIRFRFSAIFLFSTLDLVVLAKNLEKCSGALFEIFGVKVEYFKNYLNELQNFTVARKHFYFLMHKLCQLVNNATKNISRQLQKGLDVRDVSCRGRGRCLGEDVRASMVTFPTFFISWRVNIVCAVSWRRGWVARGRRWRHHWSSPACQSPSLAGYKRHRSTRTDDI